MRPIRLERQEERGDTAHLLWNEPHCCAGMALATLLLFARAQNGLRKAPDAASARRDGNKAPLLRLTEQLGLHFLDDVLESPP